MSEFGRHSIRVSGNLDRWPGIPTSNWNKTSRSILCLLQLPRNEKLPTVTPANVRGATKSILPHISGSDHLTPAGKSFHDSTRVRYGFGMPLPYRRFTLESIHMLQEDSRNSNCYTGQKGDVSTPQQPIPILNRRNQNRPPNSFTRLRFIPPLLAKAARDNQREESEVERK